MFSTLLKGIIDQAERVGTSTPVDQRTLLSLLEKSASGNQLGLDEIIELMNGTLIEGNKKLILDFSGNYRRPHDRDILLLPPLYFASTCENKCLYCNFSRHDGVYLSLDEFRDEFDALLDLGYRSIELVSSQDPTLYLHQEPFDMENQSFDISKALTYFKLAKQRLVEKGNGMLTSNIPPVDKDSFTRLKSFGVDCYLVWLEAFHPSQYEKLHYQRGPKANQAFRLNSFERAIDAGIEHLAGAFLRGLYDWRKEEVVLYCFNQYLKTKNGRGFSIIGTPRLKGPFIQSELVRRYQVSDEDYELDIALARILYDGILWLQTRESFRWNHHLITRYGAGVILTLTSSTAPGGYHKPSTAEAQFPVHKQKLDESVSHLGQSGYQILFDWDSQTLSEFQRTI